MSFTDRALKFFIFKKFELVRIFDIKFTVHSSLVIVACLLPLTAFSADPIFLIYFVLCHMLMLFFHELGHAFFAKPTGSIFTKFILAFFTVFVVMNLRLSDMNTKMRM